MRLVRFDAAWRSLRARYWSLSRAKRDIWVLASLTLPIATLLIIFDVNDNFFQFTRAYEHYELDEIVTVIFCLGPPGIIYARRRIVDLRSEMERRGEAEREAHRLARFDPLTGLPNRRQFIEDFHECAEGLNTGAASAVLLVDLDYFKPINDLYGHRLGDEVLRIVGGRLAELVDGCGRVARLGGDEFGILMSFPKSDDLPHRVARRVVQAIPRPIPLAALSLEVGVSVGVTIYDPDESAEDGIIRHEGSRVEAILRQADMALYQAKSEGRGLYRVFDRDMSERLRQRIELEREITGAIQRGEIVPYYQPLVDLKSKRTIGYELLARWQHPVKGVLLPDTLIPVAEDTGAIGDLTYSLLAQAVRDIKDQPPEILLSLNLSPRQFADPCLSQRIAAILAEAGFPPERLEIEIAETAMLQRLEEAKVTLRAVRKLGIRIALDDFGTGYAGLYHLRELDLDVIKIDREFVTRMLEKPGDARLVEAMIELGHALGLQTTAEGIETQEVLDRLTALGCDVGQGFLLGRPRPEPTEAITKPKAAEPRRKIA